MEKIIIIILIIAIIVLIIMTIQNKKQISTPPLQQPIIQPQNIPQQENIEGTVKENFYPYKMKYLLTKNEYYFYNNLKQITMPLNLQILAKIRLADLIEVDTNQVGKDFMKYFGKIKSKHIDFAITDNMKVIALLELDDSSHNNNDRKTRDNFVNNALLKAGYTVIRTNGNLDIIKQALIDKGYHINLYQNTIL